jgi:hypothetical protein
MEELPGNIALKLITGLIPKLGRSSPEEVFAFIERALRYLANHDSGNKILVSRIALEVLGFEGLEPVTTGLARLALPLFRPSVNLSQYGGQLCLYTLGHLLMAVSSSR